VTPNGAAFPATGKAREVEKRGPGRGKTMRTIAGLIKQARRAEPRRLSPAETLHRRLLENVPTAREVLLSDHPAGDERQGELETRFFYSIKLRNGIRKFTYPHRLDDLNDLVSGLLPPHRPLKVMDVAASSGVNALEWADSLRRAGVDCHMVAGDLSANGFLVSVGSHLRVLTDGAGYPLQFDIFGKAIQNPPGRRQLALYFLPLSLIRIMLFARFASLREACRAAAGEQYAGTRWLGCRGVALVSSKLKALPGFSVVEDDILSNTGLRNGFHVLRAANVLNRKYFDDDTLVAMLLNLRSRLVSGGLFIVCMTDGRGRNDGTVFTLTEAGEFDVVARLGGGSEIEDLVLGLGRGLRESARESAFCNALIFRR
jgi:hypothetical protein